jgi:hypothetical protein
MAARSISIPGWVTGDSNGWTSVGRTVERDSFSSASAIRSFSSAAALKAARSGGDFGTNTVLAGAGGSAALARQPTGSPTATKAATKSQRLNVQARRVIKSDPWAAAALANGSEA